MADRSESRENQAPAGSPDETPKPFPFRGYVFLNLLFWGFCALEVLIIRLWLKDIQGVIFFFMLLAVGFTLVSIYDAVCDRLAVPLPSDKEQTPSSPDPGSSSS